MVWMKRYCPGCGKRRRPLKWAALWGSWLCWPCIEVRVAREMERLEREHHG
jgi:hypothetical protein